MKYRYKWRMRQVRKYNTFLDNCANSTHSPALKIIILAGKINAAGMRQNGQAIQKG